MKLPATIKRVPRWAWYVTGGLVIGTGAIRLYENRTTADEGVDDYEEDPTTAAATGSTYGSAGVIVPPVIAPAQDDDGFGIGTLQELYFGGVGELFGTFTTLLEGQGGQNQQLIDILAGAGSSPNPGTTQGPNHHPVTTGGNGAPHTAPARTCRQESPAFPFHQGSRGAVSAKSCYKLGCQTVGDGKKKKKVRVRIFANGDKIALDQPCGGSSDGGNPLRNAVAHFRPGGGTVPDNDPAPAVTP